jgi:putative DNA primase/helicase
LTDEEILRLAEGAANGEKFRRLWAGDITGYSSQSEADMALIAVLAFWTGPNPEQLDRLFRRSGLYRAKWDEQRGDSSYGRITIDAVLREPRDYYSPSGARCRVGSGDSTTNGVDSNNPTEEMTDSEPTHCTDKGNAHRLVRRSGEDLFYCWDWSKWLVWDERHWATDRTGEVTRLTKQMIEDMFRWATEKIASLKRSPGTNTAKLKKQLKRVKEILSWAVRSESAARINALIDLARSEPGIPILPEHLDQQAYLLNCMNGTLELKTGTLREHRRTDRITKLCPVEYHADATCPKWLAFLDQIFNGDAELIAFVRRLCGYILTGDVSEHALFLCWGTGANGKSTLLNVLMALLGEDYATKAASDLLLAKRWESHSTEKADLFGKRLVVCSETDQHRRLAEALLKDLTGGEKQSARRMREDYWRFDPTYKIILGTNHKPVVQGTGRTHLTRLNYGKALDLVKCTAPRILRSFAR